MASLAQMSSLSSEEEEELKSADEWLKALEEY
jgi:hypothetical protein